MKKTIDITLLCKVVDNFGDIGVVYRLARTLEDIKKSRNADSVFPDFTLRIICDNLKSFSLLEPRIEPDKEYQKAGNWEIFQWDAEKTCFDAFSEKQPEIIIECFQCGRPEWLEKLLFDVKVPEIVNIIMLDYLTAEDYAETFHKLLSLTRSSRVKKVNFMPGFTEKTGGLILDEPFISSLQKRGAGLPLSSALRSSATLSPKGYALKNPQEKAFNAVFFSYPRNQAPCINALSSFSRTQLSGKLNVLPAKGAGFQSFLDAYNSSAQKDFSLKELPFLPQIQWDSLLAETPLLFIRGEDSLSRACLCGVPFVWHAYPQSEEYQLVKVKALLQRMKRHFTPELFKIVEKCWLTYNQTSPDSAELEKDLSSFLQNYEKLKSGFEDFSASLLHNGDLAQHLLQFITECLENNGPENI